MTTRKAGGQEHPACCGAPASILLLAALLAPPPLPAGAAAVQKAAAPPAAAASGDAAPAPAANGSGGAKADAAPEPEDARAEYMRLLIAAEDGSPQAALALGLMHERGVGTARNFSKALQCYEKAAFAGLAEGWFRLGVAQEAGMGMAADAKAAAESWRRAADMGFAPAQYEYARLLLTGTGVARDAGKGMALLAKAAATHPRACYELGIIQLEGLHGQKKDEARARQGFLDAAMMGHVGAMLRIAGMRKDGRGGGVNLPGAMAWYLVVMRSGLGTASVAREVDGLRPRLTEAQLAAAEKEADSRLAAFGAGKKPDR